MEDLSLFFRSLSDETRLRILVLLAQAKLCVCELHGILELPQPKVSKHLAKLRDLGYVDVERKDKFIEYRLNKLNDMQMQILQDIVDTIEAYPQFKKDQKNLLQRENYICK